MSLNRDFNPFANAELRIPLAMREQLNRLSSSTGTDPTEKSDPEDTPFIRYVDAWLAAAALGVASEAFIPVDKLERVRFIMGSVLQHDLESIEFLMLVAIAHTNDPYVVGETRKILDIVEGYAVGGLPILMEMVDSGQLSASRNLARQLESKFATVR